MSGQGWGGSAEHSAIGNIDRSRGKREELAPVYRNAHEKAAREVFESPKFSIQEKDFTSLYGAEVVAREIAHAAQLQRMFELRYTEQERIAEKIASVFEAIVVTQGQVSRWFGDARTLRTSRFDDLHNKVDMIAEWPVAGGESRVLGLGVDITFGRMKVESKFKKIREEIDNGSLGEIKYFRDMHGTVSGTRHYVPRTVIGVSEPVVRELAVAWLNNDTKTLLNHPIQLHILNQIASQLSMMKKYAEAKGQGRAVIAFDQALANIRKIRDNKASIKVTQELLADPIHKEISEQARSFFAVTA